MPDLDLSPANLANQLRVLKVALAARDSYTNTHCDRVVHFAAELGKLCGLSKAELDMLHVAAAVHDIGKLGIPDRVLLKSGTLLPEEWAIMQSHAEMGQNILQAVDLEDIDQIALVVRHHHEAYDGLGYPDSLQGEAIPVMSRILALADSYDAMASSRPYRRAMPHRQIMNILESETGHKYDPYLHEKFLPLVEAAARKSA